jgi:hypothetical protein
MSESGLRFPHDEGCPAWDEPCFIASCQEAGAFEIAGPDAGPYRACPEHERDLRVEAGVQDMAYPHLVCSCEPDANTPWRQP